MEYDDVHLLCGKYWIILDGELTEGHAELTAEEKKPEFVVFCCWKFTIESFYFVLFPTKWIFFYNAAILK